MARVSAMSLVLRGMCAADIPDVLDVQAAAYPAILNEEAGFFLNRLALSPATCWVARDAASDAMQGYLVAYPWSGGLPPELGQALPSLPAGADHWFLHDCAVHPRAQGRGVGKALYEAGRRQAWEAGLRHGCLVALAEAVPYWLRLGYATPVGVMPGLAEKLRQYGEGACYLARAMDSVVDRGAAGQGG
ncbi:GCN5-related N-acetyltransferase [plant metagenome]|uniref:GCN5-related N-acetyltransferase n=3 Tax=root TaxID=1 RepID=A0A1C3K4H6_9BURK|nr:GCN5-related N-acetyltransferase [Orrella dioscoreae]SOE46640.1 GCN5-related N-acetyltransferase [Orrella dioscoreae]